MQSRADGIQTTTGAHVLRNRVTLLEDDEGLPSGYLFEPTWPSTDREGTGRKGLALIALKLDEVGHCTTRLGVRDQFYPWIIAPPKFRSPYRRLRT